jgi:hypothetical protein
MSFNEREEIEFNKHCENFDFIPSIIHNVDRIIVIGDLHGDWKVTINALKLAKVIDNDNNWIGGNTHVVQVGDQVDRCRPLPNKICGREGTTKNDEGSDVKILKFMSELHSQASKNGGAVISLLGNHEILNVDGIMNYVSYKGLVEFNDYKDPKNPNGNFSSGLRARKHAFAAGNELGTFLGCTRLSSVVIGSNIFVHAGLVPEFLQKAGVKTQEDIIKINDKVRRWLVGKISRGSVDHIVGSYKHTMFWARILGAIPPNITYKGNDDGEYISKCKKYLEPALSILNVGNMIVGHTPQFYAHKNIDIGINSTCNNQIHRVDQGTSGAFDKFDETPDGETAENRKIQVLEILNDETFNILKSK